MENHSFDSLTFVGKVMSLLFNMLSRLIIDFLPRNKYLLISWLQSSSAVIWEPQKIKSDYRGPAPVGSRDSLGRTALAKRIEIERDKERILQLRK